MLLDLLYELPARTDTDTFVVTEDVVRGSAQLARGLTAADIVEEDSSSPERESA